jgi:superfamily I DNA/RNA helicase
MLKALEQLNPDQKQAATLAESAFVRAGPGTGKTQLLSGRVGWRVEHCGYAPRQVLALTFTRRAVSQFRQRLEELLGPALSS